MNHTDLRSAQADFDHVESLRTALNGAYAAYVVTNYWEKMSADLERKQGMAVADVAKVNIVLAAPSYRVFEMFTVA
jgi:uncharacterized protein YbjT (DUF2867 family)